MSLPAVTLHPIGVVHSPFHDKASAPRQPSTPFAAAATIELFPGHHYEHALSDIETWEYLWVLFCFHRNVGWRPKVLPPRSAGRRRGVFATRSPHRPNPIGLSVVRLLRVEALTLHVADVDMLDGTPVFDLKPYVAYADARPNARGGWLTPLTADHESAAPTDPEPGFAVHWTEPAVIHAAWIQATTAFDMRTAVDRVLSLGPQPHPYRRIRPTPEGFQLASQAWRIDFQVTGRLVTVTRVHSGYRPRELTTGTAPDLPTHRAFVERFGCLHFVS